MSDELINETTKTPSHVSAANTPGVCTKHHVWSLLVQVTDCNNKQSGAFGVLTLNAIVQPSMSTWLHVTSSPDTNNDLYFPDQKSRSEAKYRMGMAVSNDFELFIHVHGEQ